MAEPNPTQPVTAVGKTLSVKVTTELYDDLAVIVRTGVTQSDAVRQAVRLWAELHRTHAAHGLGPATTPPVLEAYQLRRTPGYEPPASRYDGPSDAVGTPISPPSHPATTTVRGSDA